MKSDRLVSWGDDGGEEEGEGGPNVEGETKLCGGGEMGEGDITLGNRPNGGGADGIEEPLENDCFLGPVVILRPFCSSAFIRSAMLPPDLIIGLFSDSVPFGLQQGFVNPKQT